MINQSVTDESKMPPRCCTQPLATPTIKAVLILRDEQAVFLKAVAQFSTPWESRVFCPAPSCGEFIPPPATSDDRPDPDDPNSVQCPTCGRRVCVLCKRAQHRPGRDCPADRELAEVLRLGAESGWRRCHKCRNLVELTAGCSHVTCRCKAQFCYLCGAVW